MDNLQKKDLIFELRLEIDDYLVNKFFDTDSDKLLDDKIEVLKALIDGKTPSEIPKYYDVLELYPEDEHWD